MRRSGFEDEWHAEGALRRFLEGRKLGFDADPHETVAVYLTKWLKGMEFLLKPTTYARYRTYVLCELIPVFGKLRLEELAHDHIAAYAHDHIAAYAHEQLDAGRGRQAVYHCLATLSSALGTAVRTHRLPFNAAQPLPMRKPRPDERVPWTAEQAVAFLGHCRNVDPAFADLFEVIIGTGLRKGEALGLQRPCVRMDDRVMYIRHTLSAIDNHELVLTAPKTRKSRNWVPLSERVAAALQRAMARSTATINGHVFQGPDGQPLHPAAVRRRFHELREQAALPHVTIHDLRHLAATLALEGNVSMAVISKTLRHSTLSTTANIYSHLTWDVARAAVNTIEARLHLVEARTQCGRDITDLDVGSPNPLFSNAA
ncbi:tyrosine-type recombinase/integrase [Kitasatospora purpeofusca]|uniref:tyrosine-type recombinase/integrase n=1 Tax=Kitasatospora purpeofusca TaxID=67352 RepID=UPI00224E0246|nr:site-specific integrase [Kitasatospora purpeofusca]MCX4757230.1 site-specific integrase [Kitasatospora purpeofusca]WSR35015.1 site-specific integrase [Kitasatospora purpeofusca]WSR43345.1 site-specific integrase [Kitasatospora purpeofusca]